MLRRSVFVERLRFTQDGSPPLAGEAEASLHHESDEPAEKDNCFLIASLEKPQAKIQTWPCKDVDLQPGVMKAVGAVLFADVSLP